MKRRLWNNWEVIDKLGQGSYSEVYKAVKKVDGIPLYCAVKYISLPKVDKEKNGTVIHTDEIIASLKQEINIIQKINGHRNILNYLNFHQEPSDDKKGADCYIYMELAEDIEKYFSRVKRDTAEVLQLGIDICQALEVCEDKNIIHRDIKPSNIFRGEDGVFKLGDFGSAVVLGQQINEFHGTYNYIAPEIYKEETPDYTSDIYSLGLVMYKLLNNNKLPFVDNTTSEIKALEQRMNGKTLPKIKGIDTNVSQVLLKACAFKKEERYQSPTEFLSELKKVHFKITGTMHKTKKISNFDKTISIQEMKKLETKEKHSMKYLFNENNREKLKKFSGRFFVTLIITCTVLFLLTQCNKDKECEDGYIKRFNMCVEGYYTCDDEGYTLNGEQCEKVLESKDAIPEVGCEKGYQMQGQLCVKSDTKKAEKGFYCQTGYTLNGTMCQRPDVRQPVVNASCPNGYTLYEDKCVSLDYHEATMKQTCPAGYNLTNGVCIKSETNNSYLKKKYSCPNGGTLNGVKCEDVQDAKKEYNWWFPSYSCPSSDYRLLGTKCYKTYDATATNYCEQGILNGSNCVVTSTVAATVTFECAAGYEVVGNQCTKALAQAPNVTLTCDTGYELKDNVCQKMLTLQAENGYHCEEGYTLNDKKCDLYSQVAPITKYKCSNGYELRDNKCVKLDTKKPTAHYEKKKEATNEGENAENAKTAS